MKEKEYKEFCRRDPYNPNNTVKGIIYRSVDQYGDMLIQEINGDKMEQYIHATPKFYYPGNFTSPRVEFKSDHFPDSPFSVFEKLDGTNILMFTYVDAEGKQYISYKTRLTPFLRTDGFKDWIKLWEWGTAEKEDMLDKFKHIPGNHAFELYGYLNEILIKYDVPLTIRYLYTVNDDGNIVYLGNDGSEIYKGNGRDDAYNTYLTYRDKAESLFNDGKQAEGFVFYFQSGDVYKCKPVCVVEEQSESPYIDKKEIITTALNASESIDSLSELEEETVALLRETFDSRKVEASLPRIHNEIQYVIRRLEVQQKAINVMKDLGYTWSEEKKNEIMRNVMNHFPKKMSSFVYSVLSPHTKKHK